MPDAPTSPPLPPVPAPAHHRWGMLVAWLAVGLVVGAVVQLKLRPLGGSPPGNARFAGNPPSENARNSGMRAQTGQVAPPDAAVLSDALANAVAVAAPSVASVTATRSSSVMHANSRWSLGCAVLFRVTDRRLLLVTNDHAVRRMASVRVGLGDVLCPATVVGEDEPTDLALLAIDRVDWPPDTSVPPPAAFADSEAVRPGHLVIAIGQPYGLPLSATLGMISATGRSSMAGNGAEDGDAIDVPAGYADFLQTSAPIAPGNSGGPLVDVHGRVVGLTTWRIPRGGVGGEDHDHETGPGASVGFAIPGNLVQRVAADLAEYGTVRRAAMGIAVRAVPAELRNAYGRGVWVSGWPGAATASPAWQAGVRRGDVIVALNGRPVTSLQQFRTRIAHATPGGEVTLTVRRGTERLEIPVTLGQATAAPPPPNDD